MNPQACAVIIVFSTSHAMKIEKRLKARGIQGKMIPVPREISADCNMGMEARVQDADSLAAVLAGVKIDCEIVHWPRE